MKPARGAVRRLRSALRRRAAQNKTGYREQLSTNTRFFRNYPQLAALARTVAAQWPAAAHLDVLHVGGSIGCEALSFLIALHEFQPAYRLSVVSTDFDAATTEAARQQRYPEMYFTPILGGEGSNPNGWREKWFSAFDEDGQRFYTPVPALAEAVRFEVLDISQPQPGRSADIVFCQNMLIHMQPALARRALRNALRLVRPHGLFVCAGVDLDLKAMIGQAGFKPVTDSLQEIHDGWESQRVHAQPAAQPCYLALEPVDQRHPDWAMRYSSLFVRP